MCDLRRLLHNLTERAGKLYFAAALHNRNLYLKQIATRLGVGKAVYGADGVDFMPEAEAKLIRIENDPEMAAFDTCMVKSHLSLSHDPNLKGRPRQWRLPVRDVLLYSGAGFVVPVTGDLKLMPGTGSDPAFRRIDIDTATGQVTGLF